MFKCIYRFSCKKHKSTTVTAHCLFHPFSYFLNLSFSPIFFLLLSLVKLPTHSLSLLMFSVITSVTVSPLTFLLVSMASYSMTVVLYPLLFTQSVSINICLSIPPRVLRYVSIPLTFFLRLTWRSQCPPSIYLSHLFQRHILLSLYFITMSSCDE